MLLTLVKIQELELWVPQKPGEIFIPPKMYFPIMSYLAKLFLNFNTKIKSLKFIWNLFWNFHGGFIASYQALPKHVLVSFNQEGTDVRGSRVAILNKLNKQSIFILFSENFIYSLPKPKMAVILLYKYF